jgi:hypothetical protein
MSDEEALARFKDASAAVLKKEADKEVAKNKRLYEMGQEFNKDLIAPVLCSIEQIIGEINHGSEKWLTSLQEHYVIDWENRKMSEMSSLGDVASQVKALESDLVLIRTAVGTGDGYKSPVLALQKELTEVKKTFDEQKTLAKTETDKRKDLEEKLRTANIKGDEKEIKKLQGEIETLLKERLKFRHYITSIFDSGFLVYLSRELSNFGVKGVNVNWKDEGVDYILSPEFRALIIDDNFSKLLDARGEVDKVKFSNPDGCEQYKVLVEKISGYMLGPNHLINLRNVWRDVSEAKRTLEFRKSKNLVWCGDYRKTCYPICPGFTPGETYCDAVKKSPYERARSELLLYLMQELHDTVRAGVLFEQKLIEWKK